MTSSALIEQFLDAVWVEQGLSENTLSAYSSDLRIFAKWLADRSMLEVTTTDLSAFLASRYKEGIGNRS
ncbi:MAG: site-specific integrase, partial [Methylococcales bacterium]